MQTLRLTVDPDDIQSAQSRKAIAVAVSILHEGGLVAFPTETVYGLGANALDAIAVQKIFTAKQRPSWDPLIVHVSSLEMLAAVTDRELSQNAAGLAEAFWPGPLTLLLPKSSKVPAIVTAGRPLVGIRMPAHPVAAALIAAARFPIAAPSANSFGRISPTCANHVLEDLDGQIDAVVDSGETLHGLESTVVDASTETVILYRHGAVPFEAIQRLCGTAAEWTPQDLAVNEADRQALASPGLGIRHYAPRARLILVDQGAEEVDIRPTRAFRDAVLKAVGEHDRIGLMLPSNWLAEVPSLAARDAAIFHWGDWEDLPELGHRLFAGLRSLDAAGVAAILCPLPRNNGLGAAIRDRLLKAARTK